MTIDRDRLRALTDAATPGPWEADDRDGNVRSASKIMPTAYDCGSADAEFIAAARQAVPMLLDQLDAAEARIAEEKRLRMKAIEAATEAEARIQAVQDLLHDADRGHRSFIETWDLRDTLNS